MNCTLRRVVPFIDPENGESGFQVTLNNDLPGSPVGEKTEWIYATPRVTGPMNSISMVMIRCTIQIF